MVAMRKVMLNTVKCTFETSSLNNSDIN